MFTCTGILRLTEELVRRRKYAITVVVPNVPGRSGVHGGGRVHGGVAESWSILKFCDRRISCNLLEEFDALVGHGGAVLGGRTGIQRKTEPRCYLNSTLK
jgi:hypothetical protein